MIGMTPAEIAQARARASAQSRSDSLCAQMRYLFREVEDVYSEREIHALADRLEQIIGAPLESAAAERIFIEAADRIRGLSKGDRT